MQFRASWYSASMKLGVCVRWSVLALVVYASGFTGTPAIAQVNELYHASERGDLALVKALLSAHADPNEGIRGSTPLAAASGGGHLDVVEALLAAGADVNVGRADGGLRPLLLASDHGHLRVVQALLAAGADVDGKGAQVTPLIAASRKGNLAIVRVLLAAKADVDATRRIRNTTALMEAIDQDHAGDHLETIRALLQARANVNAIDGTGATALMQAASRGQLTIVRALLAANASVNIVPAAWRKGHSSTGPTALTAAVSSGHSDVVEALIAAHADVNTGTDEYIPLLIACAGGRPDQVRMLLAAGADVNAKQLDGSTALTLALKGGHQEVAELLKSAMAASSPPK